MIRLISGLLIAAFAGLIAVLIILINKAIETNRFVFTNRVNSAIHEVGNSFNLQGKLTSVFNIDPDGQAIKLPETAEKVVVNIIDSTFRSNNLYIEYKYGIYLHTDEKKKTLAFQFGTFDKPFQLETCMNSLNSRLKFIQTSFMPVQPNQYAHYHLAVYFPNLSSYLVSQIRGLLIVCSLLSLILLFSFFYFLKTILRQKHLAELKNDFINNLTHEFKTPLFSIGLAAKFLKRDANISTNEEQVKHITLIEGENNRLKNQVDKILQVALIDSDNFLLEKQVVDVHKIITDVISSFELAIKEKKAIIKLRLADSDVYLETDELHFKNTFYNLIDNALKYSDINVEISVTTIIQEIVRGQKKQNELIIIVADNGIGINRNEQKNIFQKFYRIETGNIHTVKGFGLGLSYVKSIIDAHKGFISLESSSGKGSSFIIHLPL